MKTKSFILLAVVLFIAAVVRAQDTNALPPQVVTLLNSLKYQQGTIDLRGGLATLNVPKDFNYLGPDDAETVLVKLWGNPPSDQKPLGLLMPAGMTPASSNAWVVTIEYSEDGYVKDNEASNTDYAKLLTQMQQAVASNNKARQDKRLSDRNARWLGRPAALRRGHTQIVLGQRSQNLAMSRKTP